MNEAMRFEKDLQDSEELRKKLNDTVLRLRAEGRLRSEAEQVAAAAQELGYQVTASALEQSRAACEELDPGELAQVSGGFLDDLDLCWKDHNCGRVYINGNEDSQGHDNWCLTGWHCHTALLHTEGGTTYEHCWSDYQCMSDYHCSRVSG